MDAGSPREIYASISQGGMPPPTPVIPVPFLPVIPVPDTGIHSFPAKPHGCRIESGMTLWEDGCRITP
uniref:Uncharacterized protein n=1 Tax=Chlorobium phaeobacteroides (strain BS1) TaxID=331678 RepID=B3EMF2_CHLPB